MAHFLERLRRDRKRVVLLSGAAVLVVGGLLIGAVGLGRSSATIGGEDQVYVVQQGTFTVPLSFSGRVAPGERLDVMAPFDATVQRVAFAYGDRVEAGQILIELDPSDVSQGLVEAETTWLKAEDEAARMEGWSQSAEMRRASRSASAAQSDLNDLELKITETKALLDRGLVPRSEYEGLLQQRRQREMALVSAREDLAETAQRGQGAQRRIAITQRDLARARYESIRRGGGAAIVAPASGIIVRPETQGEGARSMVNAGGRVTKGQPLGVIASTNGLDVVFNLDEGDLNTVSVGQAATVTGAGFGGLTLRGRIAGIAGEAEANPVGTSASFVARVRLDPLSTEAAQSVRIGMTANVSIIAYENPSAVTVPAQAIQGAAPDAWVLVRAGSGHKPERRKVTIGMVSPSTVEITSGLRVGDNVVWSSGSAER